MTGVRAADQGGLSVLCTVSAASGDGTDRPVLWSVPFDAAIERAAFTTALVEVPLMVFEHDGAGYGPCHMLWIAGADGQIERMSKNNWF